MGGGGVVPEMVGVEGNGLWSAIANTLEPVRASDNIAPDAVPFLRVSDTPGDAGSSISLTWTKSPSDQLLPRSAGAVGPVVTDMVAGVKGYNIYRKVGANGEYGLIAKANSGDTSGDGCTNVSWLPPGWSTDQLSFTTEPRGA